MPDIRLVPITNIEIVTLDWLSTPSGLLDETNELITAILVAFNTDAQASSSDVLPDPRSTDRRGWWGDLDAAIIWNGWPIGSKFWLLTRAKILDQNAREGATVARAEAYCGACLQPFVAAGICSSFTVKAWQHDIQSIYASVKIYRGPKTAIQLEFAPLWSELFPNSPNN